MANLDLFTPQVAEARWHPNFRACLDAINEGPRRVLASWCRGFPNRDGKFVKEFQSSFNSAFWELYLNAAFRKCRHRVNYPSPSPDFEVSRSGESVHVEATVASNRDGSPPEHEFPTQLSTFDAAPREIASRSVERICNSLSAKIKKFRETYSRRPKASSLPFLIAVAPFDQPLSWGQNDLAIRMVLYGYEGAISEPGDKNKHLIYGHNFRYSWTKANGTEIELGLFSRGLAPEVSGVIFSNSATFGKARSLSTNLPKGIVEHWRFNSHSTSPRHLLTYLPRYYEHILDGLHLYLNPRARLPVPDWFLGSNIVSRTTIDTSNGLPLGHSIDGSLINRSIIIPSSESADDFQTHAWRLTEMQQVADYISQGGEPDAFSIRQALGLSTTDVRLALKRLEAIGAAKRR